jgi:hypothetical protein
MPTDVLQRPFQPLNPISDQAPVSLDLGFAWASSANSAAKTLQVRPLAGQTRQQVFVLSQFDLKSALFGLGSAGEDIQNQRGPVDDFYVSQSVFQVALLGRRQFVVADERVESASLGQLFQLLQFALANVDVGRPVNALKHRTDNLSARAVGQLAKLSQRVLNSPSRPASLHLNTHEICALFALGGPF